jgi:putative phage-type endonuclease
MSALVQQSDEWLAKRRSMIGASDAPVIMGVSPWATQYKLWQEKLQLIEPKKQTKAMRDGINGEDEARVAFINHTGIIMAPDVVFHQGNEFMMASLDGISPYRKHIVEIKRPGEADHLLAKKREVPEKYYPQVQHQIDVCEVDMAYYWSYRGPNDAVLLEVYRDDKYIKRMVPLEKAFWDCMNEFIAPKMTERDYEIKEDDIWHATASQWLDISKELKALEAKEKELRELLISQSANSSSMGGGVRVSRIVRKGNVDYAQIPELQNVNLERYRKNPIETWRIAAGE